MAYDLGANITKKKSVLTGYDVGASKLTKKSTASKTSTLTKGQKNRIALDSYKKSLKKKKKKKRSIKREIQRAKAKGL